MWDIEPWGNDSAADWFGEFMDSCKVRREWLKGINTDVEDEPEIVRAAIALFIMLGRVYVWPVKHFDRDLELAISKAEALQKNELMAEVEELVEALKVETEELKSRRKKSDSATNEAAPPERPWWKFW